MDKMAQAILFCEKEEQNICCFRFQRPKNIADSRHNATAFLSIYIVYIP
jgi:hypothetical protein